VRPGDRRPAAARQIGHVLRDGAMIDLGTSDARAGLGQAGASGGEAAAGSGRRRS